MMEPELQAYSDIPPGDGFAVIYAGVCLVNGKRYVGRHMHGKNGLSVRKVRWSQHMSKTSGCVHFGNAIQYHGRSQFDWFVLERVPEEEVALSEGEWMFQFQSLDQTVGYNIRSADGYRCSSEWSRMTKVIQNRPEQKEKLREAKLSKREIELSACATEADREKLMELFAKRDAYNAQVRERKERGEVRVKRGTPEWFAKQKANRAKKDSR